MRKKIIAGNWKMHMGPGETATFVKDFLPLVQTQAGLEWVVFPPYVSLPALQNSLKTLGSGKTNIKFGAQNCHESPKGAFTGEISVNMLKELGCTYTLVGHSERRQYFGESNSSCSAKIAALNENGIIPMYCVGETLSEREKNQMATVLITQTLEGLKNWRPVDPLVIAYEPVWAIGTGKVATPQQAEEAHRVIRQALSETYGAAKSAEISILYGGSVKPENSQELALLPNIDGFLVGGASLNAKSFAQIGQIPL